MKLTYLTLFLLITLGFVSCRKDKNDIDIKTHDEQQITNYISANGLTNMKKAEGDTSGIYYEILSQGTGKAIAPYDTISYVLSQKTVDGLHQSTDTIANHLFGFAGQISPKGLQLAINNLMKTKGTRARVIVPSRLAYGINGFSTGDNRIRGNESIVYYIHVIDNQKAYDEQSIQSYFKNNNINPAEFTRINSGTYEGLYYKIRKQGTGTTLIKDNSTVSVTYRGQLLNNVVFDPSNYTAENNASTFTVDLSNKGSVVPGFEYAVSLGQKEGTDLTVIMPSRLGYGRSTQGTSIPTSSCLFFEMSIGTVTNP
ncbi:FKBP-type peptidyl-prolyl cis-trans isomerase [Mucilaginibacter sp. Bleaf8]|uniref:FKBP-type peptidyl-prolyl cis-trans isomerase n=1 Tax=Mucilaginibacter sp. Bleaf8 TaxID=2834430 RepID=UPI001BCFB469|nr:FKBP-type peptidyl-prolyl cis-trans isomerase [Mucilaginibacter sp. Bleaf8]MBS7564297.1 FKBP-type peptidyl-prolyl cis-trans isomerase [Mucilaginibacter sp. Bleaf8]